MKKLRKVFALILCIVLVMAMCAAPVLAADATAPPVEAGSSVLLPIAGIVAAVLLLAGLSYFIAKRGGKIFVDVAATVASAVKKALEGTSLDKTIISTVLQMIIEALIYVQSLYADDLDYQQKVDKALDYIKDLAEQFSVPLSENDIYIISYVLGVGFSVIGALPGNSVTVEKMYTRMADSTGASKASVLTGAHRLNRRLGAALK